MKNEPSYMTKSIDVEVSAGRYVKFISPEGLEHVVHKSQEESFRKQNGVDEKWIMK